MKTHSLCRMVAVATVLLQAAPASAALNPSAVHCKALGYEYVTAQTPRGPRGLCKLPGDRLVDAWEFFRGTVAQDVNYCGLKGLATRHVEDDAICKGCAVCVEPGGAQKPVAEAMGLSFQESQCGDGECGTAENHANCPSDCATGLYDDDCDGAADDICDKDCVDMKLPDPDCSSPASSIPAPGGKSEGCGCASGGAGPGPGILGLMILGAWWRRKKRFVRWY